MANRSLRLSAAHLTDIGGRPQQEDAIGMPPTDPRLVTQKGWLYMVADGVGGYAGGRQASQRAIQVATQTYYESSEPDVGRRLEQAIQQANAVIYAEKQGDPALAKMGTTLTAAVVLGDQLMVANVGDSRAYLVRNGVARRLTRDHSWLEEQFEKGAITPEEGRKHPMRSAITRCIGSEPTVQVDVFPPVPLQAGDTVLLCTDGLHNLASDQEIGEAMGGQQPPQAAQRLVGLARQRGAPDNVAVLAVGVGAPAPSGFDTVRVRVRPKLSTATVTMLAAVTVALVVTGVWALGGFTIPWLRGPTPVALVTKVTPTPSSTLAPTATTRAPATWTPSPIAISATTVAPTSLPTLPQPPTRTPPRRGTVATSVQAVPYPTPALQAPLDNSNLGGPSITLHWQWSGTLGKDEHFDVQVFKEEGGRWKRQPDMGAWTEASEHAIDLRQWPAGRYGWRVQVIRGRDQVWEANLSDPSPMWTFRWSPSAPVASPTATPR